MTSQHSVIEHRANYFFLKLEEDYLEIFFKSDKHRHCKAAILSILEHWMNAKRTATSTEDDLYVYLSYPQFVKRMFELYGRSTVIKSLDELTRAGLILKRPYTDQFNQDTFEYRLNIQVVQTRLQSLPDVPVRGSLKVNGGSLKTNDPSLKTDGGSFENKPGGSPDLNGGSFKSKRNVDTTIDTNLDTSQIDEEIVATSAEDRNAPAPIDFTEQKKKRDTDPRIPAVKIGDEHDRTRHSVRSSNDSHSIGSSMAGNGDAVQTSRDVASSHSQADTGNEETVKLPAVSKHTPAAGAAIPPSSGASAQASRDGTYSTPAQRSGSSLSSIPASPGAVQAAVIPKRPRKAAKVTQAKPAIALTAQQQAFWDLWCGVWFNAEIKPDLTETAYTHVTRLAPYITTSEQLNSLIDFTRKDLADSQNIKRKMVQLGNMVHSYPGWKQTQQKTARDDGPALGGYYYIGSVG